MRIQWIDDPVRVLTRPSKYSACAALYNSMPNRDRLRTAYAGQQPPTRTHIYCRADNPAELPEANVFADARMVTKRQHRMGSLSGGSLGCRGQAEIEHLAPALGCDFDVDRDARCCARTRAPAPRRSPWRWGTLESNRAGRDALAIVGPSINSVTSAALLRHKSLRCSDGSTMPALALSA